MPLPTGKSPAEKLCPFKMLVFEMLPISGDDATTEMLVMPVGRKSSTVGSVRSSWRDPELVQPTTKQTEKTALRIPFGEATRRDPSGTTARITSDCSVVARSVSTPK